MVHDIFARKLLLSQMFENRKATEGLELLSFYPYISNILFENWADKMLSIYYRESTSPTEKD